jgi:hypothetical protein
MKAKATPPATVVRAQGLRGNCESLPTDGGTDDRAPVSRVLHAVER